MSLSGNAMSLWEHTQQSSLKHSSPGLKGLAQFEIDSAKRWLKWSAWAGP